MKRKPPRGYWNDKINVLNDAKKYQRYSDWKKNSPGAYQSAYRNNWFDECRKYFESRFSVEYGYWQKKARVVKDAKKYNAGDEWRKNSRAAYQSALKNGWLKECYKHMTRKRGIWREKTKVINDSKKYKRRSDWAKNSRAAYKSALKNNWLDECFAPKDKKNK